MRPYLDGKRVDASEIDPAKHQYIGQFRTPRQPNTKYIDKDGNTRYGDVLVCPCGRHLWTLDAVFDHWQMGHFDEPQYVTVGPQKPSTE